MAARDDWNLVDNLQAMECLQNYTPGRYIIRRVKDMIQETEQRAVEILNSL
jgi:hypothetical protein